MATAALDYSYRYLLPSEMSTTAEGKQLLLSTSLDGDRYPYFFEGRVHQPALLARLLATVSRVVGTRYYTPPNMLAHIIALSDPVVTSGGGILRFEGFSTCCSSYVRVDVSPDAYSGRVVGNGTTNVDFNAPMRAALAQVRDSDRMSLSVGPDEFVLKRGIERTIERKVKLPIRWLKGFVEVQAYQSAMEHRFTLDKTETIKFLRSLPRGANNRSSFVVVPAGKGLRLSQTKSSEGIAITGLNRLQLLQDFAPFADELRVFAPANGQASEWQLRCRDLTITITVSADVSRGFSGEGQVLQNLGEADSDKISTVRTALKWQSVLNVATLQHELGLDTASLKTALAMLGSQGLIGFDCAAKSYFHRELPFDMSAVESMHPRLVQARKLVDGGHVSVVSEDEAKVKGTDVTHEVRIREDTFRCTCQWYAKYQGSRGPCKHVLAAQLAMGSEID